MRKRNSSFNMVGAVGLVGFAGLLAVGVVLLNPIAEWVDAANGWDIDLNAGGDLEASSVSITMGGNKENDQLNASSADPNESAGLVKRTASVEIGATDGYIVTLSGNPDLTGANSNNRIPTVTSNTTLAQMNNQWGWYAVEGDADCSALQTMKQMKPTGDQIAAGTLDAKTTKQFTMCFGAKVNGEQVADTYSNTVTLSVVAQPRVVQTFGGIKTMQEMTSSICGAAAVNDTAYLRDTRDDKSYWVTKLADGNCWMSQNLDLNITTDSSGESLTSNINTDNSDIVASDVNGGANWGGNTAYPPQATFENATGVIEAGDTASTGTSSWDLGLYVLNAPDTTSPYCGNNSEGLNYSGDSDCALRFTDVSSEYTASSNPNFYKLELYAGTDGSTCTKTANTSVSTDKTGACAQYDAHYLVGNYYQWNVATAGTGGEIVDADASGSICPKGWKLPNSGANQLQKGSFNFMLLQYGLANEDGSKYESFTGVSSVDGNNYDVALNPLFFVRGGYIDSNYPTRLINRAGMEGAYWSSHAGSTVSTAYRFRFFSFLGSIGIVPAVDAAHSRYYGWSVRCLVPTS